MVMKKGFFVQVFLSRDLNEVRVREPFVNFGERSRQKEKVKALCQTYN
jgi:hypothetical protein